MSLTQERKALELTKEIREKEKQVTELRALEKTAKQMFVEGIPVPTISKCTGRSEVDVKKLVWLKCLSLYQNEIGKVLY